MREENYTLEGKSNAGYALFKNLPEDIKAVLEGNLKDIKHEFTQETPFFWADIEGARFAVPIGERETPQWNPLTTACFIGDQIKPSLKARDAELRKKIIEIQADFYKYAYLPNNSKVSEIQKKFDKVLLLVEKEGFKMGEMADAISCGDSDDKYALTVANRYFDKENAVKVSELEIKTGDEIEDLNEYCPNEESAEKCLKCPYGKKTTQQGVINCGYAQRRWVSLDSLKALLEHELKEAEEKRATDAVACLNFLISVVGVKEAKT